MAAVIASSTARIVMYDNDAFWAVVATSSVARSELLEVALEHSTASATHTHPSGVTGLTRVALLQQRISIGTRESHAGSGVDTYSTSSSAWLNRFARTQGLTHRVNTTNNLPVSWVRYVVME